MLKCAQREFVLVFITLDSDINARIAKIVSDSHVSHSYHCQARILQFVSNNLRNLFAQRLGNALGAMHANSRQEAVGRRQEK